MLQGESLPVYPDAMPFEAKDVTEAYARSSTPPLGSFRYRRALEDIWFEEAIVIHGYLWTL